MKEYEDIIDMEDDLDDEIDEAILIEFVKLQSCRYLFRRPYRIRSSSSKWEKMLYNDVYITDDEFLEHFRMPRECVVQLNDHLKDDEAFSNVYGKIEKRSPLLHIMVLLKYLGSYGNEASLSKIGRVMGISKGSVNDYVKRTSNAILNLLPEVVKWPNEGERKAMSMRIKEKHSFPNCVGLIDGTLFPLAFAPTLNGEDYFTRKGGCALHGLIICDDKAKITWIELGWPGSVHDNRVWSNCDVNLNQKNHFSPKEYLLGDSAFCTSPIMVPSFKKAHNAGLTEEKEYFNTKLAKIRIKSEHCIGLLKARFQKLRDIRHPIRSRKDLRRVLNDILCACVLHNLLINSEIPDEWCESIAEYELDEDDELNQPIESNNGNTRRNQLFSYMLEIR